MPTHTITPDIKALWINALRNGGFTQIRSAYRGAEPNSYCAVGVLYHEVLNKNPNLLWALPDGEWGYFKQIFHMNDFDGMSFDDIADWIEQNYSTAPESLPQPALDSDGTGARLHTSAP